jgi:hypothetical protein
MARNLAIQHIRTTRANLDSQAGSSNLNAGEIYLITDENRLAVGLSATTYQALPKSGEVPTAPEILVIKQLTAAQYAALTPKVDTTLYIIVG